MVARSRKAVPPLAALVSAMLLLDPWTGSTPAHSQGVRQPTTIPQVPDWERERPRTTEPDAGLAPETRERVQLELQRRGYYFGDIDGVFGDQTRQAIRSYQQSIGDQPTGYLTATQIDQLNPAGGPVGPIIVSPVPPPVPPPPNGGCVGPGR